MSAAAALLSVVLVLVPSRARAEDVPVPIGLQADLLFMIAAHDRNLPSRAHGEVRMLILTKPTDASARAAAQFKTAASARRTVAGLPHVEEVAPFTSAAALAQACRARRISVVYLAPGFSAAEAGAIGQALAGGHVLTVAASPSCVWNGAVLGFDLVSGRAKLLVDLEQAARQHVAFGPEVIDLMAVSG